MPQIIGLVVVLVLTLTDTAAEKKHHSLSAAKRPAAGLAQHSWRANWERP
jgi:hypothetical protein